MAMRGEWVSGGTPRPQVHLRTSLDARLYKMFHHLSRAPKEVLEEGNAHANVAGDGR